ELEDFTVRDALRVEDDLHRLRVAAVIAVGRVWHVASRVTDPGRHDALTLSQQFLGSPEASVGQDGSFGLCAHGLLSFISAAFLMAVMVSWMPVRAASARFWTSVSASSPKRSSKYFSPSGRISHDSVRRVSSPTGSKVYPQRVLLPPTTNANSRPGASATTCDL